MDIGAFGKKLVNCTKKTRKIKKARAINFGENVQERNYYSILFN